MKKGWLTKRLGDVAKTQYGLSEPMNTDGKGFKIFRMGDVQNGRVIDTGRMKYAEISRAEFEHYQLRAGDVLFNRTNSFELVGKTGIFTLDGDYCFASYLVRLNLDRQKVLPEFLNYFMNSDRFQKSVKEKASQSINQANINAMILSNELIRFPESLSEQRRIVGILDEALDGIATAKANAERNLQNARALFESHLHAVFTDLRLAHSVRRLSELCERITKGSSPTWQGIAYVDWPGVLFVTSENVQENRLVVNAPKYVEERFNEKEKRSILRFGDVLTNLVGASIGRTAVYDRHDVANINQAVGVIRCHADKLHNHYLMYFFNSPVMKAFFHANEVNNARANISLTFVSELEVPLPPVESQKAVVGRILEYHQSCQRLKSLYQRKLAALDELKKSLLHRAFSGEL